MKKNKKILIAPTTFSQFSLRPIEYIEKAGFQIIKNNKERKLSFQELKEMLDQAVGVIAGTEEYSKEILSQNNSLKVISRLGVGLDNIDMEFVKEKKIKIFSTQSKPDLSVAELVMGLILDLARNISYCDSKLKSGFWEKRMGYLVQGKTLGLIGLGSVGKALVRISSGFNFNIIAFDKEIDQDYVDKYNVNYSSLETLLKKSDIVSIHLSLNDFTNSLINSEKIALMKTNSILINTSRGEIVDEGALYNALVNKNIAGAGIDVFENEPYNGPLCKLDNALLTPHIGAYAKEARIKMEFEASKNLIRGLNEK